MPSRVALIAGLAVMLVFAWGCGPRAPRYGGPPPPRTGPAKPFTHPIGIQFVVVPPGKVNVLPSGGLVQLESTELFRAALFSAHEITNAQYERFLADYKPQAESIDGKKEPVRKMFAAELDKLILAHRRSKTSPGDNHPVNNVSAQEAKAFCDWLTENDPFGRKYKLPESAKWEYAAYGGRDYVLYPWGNEIDKTRACYGAKGLKPVGGYPPNKFGLYDVVGNVAEWVWTDDMPEYELRGGSWKDENPRALCIRARGEMTEKGAILDHHGFRVLCEPPPLR